MHKEGAAFRSLMNCFAMRGLDRPAVRRAARDLRRAVHVHALRAAGPRRGSPEHQVRDVDRRLHLPRARVEYLGRYDFAQVKPAEARRPSRTSASSAAAARRTASASSELPRLRCRGRSGRRSRRSRAAETPTASARWLERAVAIAQARRRARATLEHLDAMMGDAPVLRRVRSHHGAQRRLLQVPQLWTEPRLLVSPSDRIFCRRRLARLADRATSSASGGAERGRRALASGPALLARPDAVGGRVAHARVRPSDRRRASGRSSRSSRGARSTSRGPEILDQGQIYVARLNETPPASRPRSAPTATPGAASAASTCRPAS